MNLPSEKEINMYNSPDEIMASEHFLGKTIEEAEEMFAENSLYYQEDLMWMGPAAFAFYLKAVLNYLQSNAASDDDFMLSCLYEIVLFRKDEKGFDQAIPTIKKIIEYVINNYSKFNVDETIYGNILEKYQNLQNLT